MLSDRLELQTELSDLPQLPAPMLVPEEKGKAKKEELTDEQAIVIGAARNAVAQKDWKKAILRYEDYFRRFGTRQRGIRKEYAGVLVQAKRIQEALQLYRQLLHGEPGDTELRLTLADVALLDDNFRLAIEVLVPALRANPENRVIATKLARAYVFVNRPLFALQVYDRYLANLQPDDDELPEEFPALLVDLDFPFEALPFLTSLLKEDSKNPKLLDVLVRAYVKLDDRERATQALNRLLALEGAREVLIELGIALNDSGNPELAQLLFSQLLQRNDADQQAILGLARSYMQLFQPDPALRLLKSFSPKEENKRSLLQARAEYHQLVGEYLDAKHVYLQLLQHNPDDHEVRLSLGSLQELPLREWEKAKAEYDKIPRGASEFRAAQRSVGRTLTAQRHFAQAIEMLKRMMAGHPGDGATMAQLVRTLGKGGLGGEAIARANAFLSINQLNRPAVRAVRLELGFVYLDLGNHHKAKLEFDKVLALPSGRTPEAFYGLARAYSQLNKPEKAEEILASITNIIGGDTRNRLLLADLFMRDYLDDKAQQMIVAVVKWDPENLAALIRLATVEGFFARQTWNISQVVATTQTILNKSPSNVRAHLDLARALAIAKKNDEAVDVFGQLIRLDPEFFLPRRERARVYHSASQFGAAQGEYFSAMHPSAEEQLHNDLLSLTNKYPGASEAVMPYVQADIPHERLENELSKVVSSTHPQASAALRRVFLDYRARSAEQSLTRIEAEVKAKDWKNYEDIPIACKLLDTEPTNTSIWFDRGQLHGGLDQTFCAIDAFSQDLMVDSREREAIIALERASLETSPKFNYYYDFFHQAGRDNLARIQRHELTGEVIVPYGDEDEYILLGYTRAIYKPREDRALNGNILSVGFRSKFDKRWHFYGTFDATSFRRFLSNRVTYDTGIHYDFSDLLRLNTGMFLNNVVENGESLRQDIYRYGFYMGFDQQYTRRWGGTATYRYARYSDENDLNELFAKTEYYFNFAPAELKVVGTLNLTGFREGTTTVAGQMLAPGEPADITGALHPYFAPNFFAYYEGRLEWKHWLNRDYFKYSNQCWYALQYGIGFDESLNPYHKLRAMFNYDVRPWISIGMDAKATLSEVYESASLLVYVNIRSPWGCR